MPLLCLSKERMAGGRRLRPRGGVAGATAAAAGLTLLAASSMIWIPASENESAEGKDEKAPFEAYQERHHRFSKAQPQTLFEAFAHVKEDGKLAMTHRDFLRAALSLRYMEASEEDIVWHCSGYHNPMLGSGPDSLITLEEFTLLTHLLTVPSHLREVAFRAIDMDGSRGLSPEELKKMATKLLPEGALKGIAQGGEGLLKSWLQRAKRSEITADEFEGFVSRLARDIKMGELRLYSSPEKDGGETGKGETSESWWKRWGKGSKRSHETEVVRLWHGGLALVSSCPPGRLQSYLQRLERAKVATDSLYVPVEDVLYLTKLLEEHHETIKKVLILHCDVRGHGVDVSTFKRALMAVQGAKQVSLNHDLVTLLFRMMDSSGKGYLTDKDLIHGLQETRTRRICAQDHSEVGWGGFVSCVKGEH